MAPHGVLGGGPPSPQGGVGFEIPEIGDYI